MRTAEDRAEAVNDFTIYVDDLVRRALGMGVGINDRVTMQLTLLNCTVQDLADVIAELREAKLARAKLELKA